VGTPSSRGAEEGCPVDDVTTDFVASRVLELVKKLVLK
jgi:hypothetical protein